MGAFELRAQSARRANVLLVFESSLSDEWRVKGYQDLVVWQESMELVERVYRITKAFPKEEVYGLSSQIRRAVVSIPSNGVGCGEARPVPTQEGAWSNRILQTNHL